MVIQQLYMCCFGYPEFNDTKTAELLSKNRQFRPSQAYRLGYSVLAITITLVYSLSQAACKFGKSLFLTNESPMPAEEKSSHRLTSLLVLIWLLYGILIITVFFEKKHQYRAYFENDSTIETSPTWESALSSMLLTISLSFAILVLVSIGLIWILRKYHREIDRRKALLDEVETILQLVEHGVCMTDEKGRVLYANSHLLEITGWALSSLKGKDLHTAIHQPPAGKTPDNPHNIQDCPILEAIAAGKKSEFNEMKLYQRNGKTIFAVLSVKPIVLMNKRKGAVISIDDVTQSRRREARLRYEAFHDGLTGLKNRSRLNEAIEERLFDTSTRQPINTIFDALLFIDLDGFKPINDTYGHEAGDMILVEVAKRLSEHAREGDVVVRQGGDEFVVLMKNLPGEGVVKRRASQLLDALMEPIELEDTPLITVGASIGIAMKQEGYTVEEWLQKADSAMYEAKENGKNCVVFAH